MIAKTRNLDEAELNLFNETVNKMFERQFEKIKKSTAKDHNQNAFFQFGEGETSRPANNNESATTQLFDITQYI